MYNIGINKSRLKVVKNMNESLANIHSLISNIENTMTNLQSNLSYSFDYIVTSVISFFIDNRLLIFISLCAILAIINIYYILRNNNLRKQKNLSNENYKKITKELCVTKIPRIMGISLKCIAIILIIISIFIVIFDILVIDNILPWFEGQNEYVRVFLILIGILIVLLLMIIVVIRFIATTVVWILLVLLCIGTLTRFLYINIKLNKYLQTKKDISKT